MKNKLKYFIFFCMFSIITVSFISCATTINVRVTRPGRLDLNGAKTIAVLPFEQSKYNPFNYIFGDGEESLEDYFIEYNSMRTEEENIINYLHNELERSFTNSPYITLENYIPTETALKYRSNVPVDIFISGEVISFKIHDLTRKIKKEIEYDDTELNNENGDRPKYYYDFQYAREVQFVFKYEIMNGSSKQVISYDTVNIDRISDNYDERKKLPSVFNIVKNELDSFVNSMSHDLQPYTITKTITLLEDKTDNPYMEKGNSLAKDGSLRESYDVFINVYNENGLFEAGYNSALLLLAMGRLDDAAKLMNEVYEKSGNPKALDALYDINNEITQAQRLNLQINGEDK